MVAMVLQAVLGKPMAVLLTLPQQLLPLGPGPRTVFLVSVRCRIVVAAVKPSAHEEQLVQRIGANLTFVVTSTGFQGGNGIGAVGSGPGCMMNKVSPVTGTSVNYGRFEVITNLPINYLSQPMNDDPNLFRRSSYPPPLILIIRLGIHEKLHCPWRSLFLRMRLWISGRLLQLSR